MKTPSISVIIPTFNRAHSLVRAVKSVLNQKFSDFEVIIVDDGSTDHTREILKGFGDRVLPVFQSNQGVSAARNTGIGRASGDWVAFLDSDDEWDPNYLSWQIDRANNNPDVIAHIVNAVTVFPDGREEDHFQGMGLSNKLASQPCQVLERPIGIIVRYGPWFVQSLMVKKEILLKLGAFNPKLSIAEDFDLVGRAALRGSFGLCNKVLVRIYRSPEPTMNLSSQAVMEGLRTVESFAGVLTALKSHRGLTPKELKILNIAEGKNKRALGNLMLRKGNKSEARLYFKEALSLNPCMRSLAKYLVSFLPEEIGIHIIRKGKYIQP